MSILNTPAYDKCTVKSHWVPLLCYRGANSDSQRTHLAMPSVMSESPHDTQEAHTAEPTLMPAVCSISYVKSKRGDEKGIK